MDIHNPWKVENLEEFLHYCCPECDLSRETVFQSKQLFLKHALDEHPEAIDCLKTFEMKVEPNAFYDEVKSETHNDFYQVESLCKIDLTVDAVDDMKHGYEEYSYTDRDISLYIGLC